MSGSSPERKSRSWGGAGRGSAVGGERLLERAVHFVQRHKWSLPLAVVSSASLLHLASQMQEGELVGVDAAVARVVMGWRGSMDGVMLTLTRLGGWEGMTVVTVVTVGVLLLLGRRREATFMASSAGGTLLLSTALKLIFQRARPEDALYLISAPSSFSFPSGHAMGSMGVLATCAVVLHVLRAPRLARMAANVAVASIACGVALSRVYLGVHYPSDVLGGQLAAAAWVSAITGWFYPRLLPGEEALEPAPSP